MIPGLVLAAGAASRMGRPKAALPLGGAGGTVLSRVVRTLLDAGLPLVAVVAGAHPEVVRAALGAPEPRVRVIDHAGWRDGQLSSLLAGLADVDEGTLEGVLVTLVDVPLVRAETVRAVVDAWRATRAPIVRPADGDRHGHPVVFDRAVFDDLRAADPAIGAKAVFARHRLRIVNVPVDDPGAFEDLDTPEDYQRLIARMAGRDTVR